MKQCIYHNTFPLRLSNGKLIDTEAKVFTEYDDTPHLVLDMMDFESIEAKENFIDRVNSGELEVLIASAVVSFGGMEGTDVLCGIITDSLPDLLSVIKEHDMIGTAAEELRKNIDKLLEAVA